MSPNQGILYMQMGGELNPPKVMQSIRSLLAANLPIVGEGQKQTLGGIKVEILRRTTKLMIEHLQSSVPINYLINWDIYRVA